MNIEFRRVSYSVGDSQILKDISFTVKHGSTLSILGFSGSGKTTVLKLLLGLIRPDPRPDDESSGIYVDGMDISTLHPKLLNRIRKRMAIVFQYGALFDSLSVRENVGYRLFEENQLSHVEIEEVVDQALGFVGMPETKDKMPWELSGGMKKRVGIARALASGAECILFDEPTSGLDPVNARKVTQFISKIKGNAELTAISVTHDLDHAFEVATDVALIDSGTLIFAGSLEEFHASKDPQVLGFVSPSGEDLVTSDMSLILDIIRRRRGGIG